MPTLTDLPPQLKPAEFMQQALERLKHEASDVATGEVLMFKANIASCRTFILTASRYDELVGAITRVARDLGFQRFSLQGDEFHFMRLERPDTK